MTAEGRTAVISRDGWVGFIPTGGTEDRDDADLITWLGVRFAKLPSGRLRPVEVHIIDMRGVDTTVLSDLGLRELEMWANTPSPQSRISAVAMDEVDPEGFMRNFCLDGESGESVRSESRPDLVLTGAQRGAHKPDGFYADVARVYTWLAMESSKPTETLARANGVPRSTAVGWIRKARERGFLGPGIRGKAA